MIPTTLDMDNRPLVRLHLIDIAAHLVGPAQHIKAREIAEGFEQYIYEDQSEPVEAAE